VGPPSYYREVYAYLNAQLKALVELQEIDSSILEKSAVIDEIPRKIHTKEKPLIEARAKLEAKKKEREALLKKKKAKESEVDELNQRIAKFKSRSAEVKTNKEYQAMLKEVEETEKLRYGIEDEILALMEELESSEKFIKEEEKNVKSEEQNLEQMKRELEAQRAEAERELGEVKKKRARFAASVDKELYEDYMKLMRKHAGQAVAEVKNEICLGCHMSIMPQLFVEIKKGEEILQCPQCDRILYYAEEKPEGAEETAPSTGGETAASEPEHAK
jgi:predicted  nucleic acid-binding Zn-ribbon protein